MIHKLIKEKFNNSFTKGDIINIPIIMQILDISRPTCQKIIGYGIQFRKLKPVYVKGKEKCYELLRSL